MAVSKKKLELYQTKLELAFNEILVGEAEEFKLNALTLFLSRLYCGDLTDKVAAGRTNKLMYIQIDLSIDKQFKKVVAEAEKIDTNI